jgi:hypothetical protein
VITRMMTMKKLTTTVGTVRETDTTKKANNLRCLLRPGVREAHTNQFQCLMKPM